jgi:tetratricopeptide (TPR) repeat protein
MARRRSTPGRGSSPRLPISCPRRSGSRRLRFRAGGASDALPALERVSALAPAGAPVWLALAVARSMLGRHDDAIAAAERAVAAAPGHPSVHLGLGDVLRQAGRGERASAAYARAVELAPDNADALNRFAAMIGRRETARTPTPCCSARSRSLRAIPTCA